MMHFLKKKRVTKLTINCAFVFFGMACTTILLSIIYFTHFYYQNFEVIYEIKDGKSRIETKTFSSVFSGLRIITRDKKPTAIVHIGQNLTVDVPAALEYLEEDLMEDGYATPNPLDTPGFHTDTKFLSNLVAYLKGDRKIATDITYMKFKAFLSRNNEANKNVILSTEAFADLDPNVLAELLNPYFKVRIVMVYRRYYDRLFTKYYTEHQNDIKPFDSFAKYAKEFNKIDDESVDELYKTFKKTFDDVVVIETMAKDDISENFFCNTVITDAPKSCVSVKEFFDSVVSMPDYGHSLEFRRLVLIAQARNILKKNVNLEEAINVLWSEEVDARTDSMPKICMDNEEEKKIEQIAIDEEAVLFPEWGSGQVESDFNLFRLKLCSLDINEILSDDHWLDIMKQIDTNIAKE